MASVSVSALTSLSDGLWFRSRNWNKPFPLQTAFSHSVYHSNRNPEKDTRFTKQWGLLRGETPETLRSTLYRKFQAFSYSELWVSPRSRVGFRGCTAFWVIHTCKLLLTFSTVSNPCTLADSPSWVLGYQYFDLLLLPNGLSKHLSTSPQEQCHRTGCYIHDYICNPST